MSAPETIAIVGAGLAGVTAAGTLRDAGFAGRIVLVGEEHALPYDRPPLSKAVLVHDEFESLVASHLPGDIALRAPANIGLRPAGWYESQRIELLLGQRVAALAPAAHEIELGDGRRLRYDRSDTGARRERTAPAGHGVRSVAARLPAYADRRDRAAPTPATTLPRRAARRWRDRHGGRIERRAARLRRDRGRTGSADHESRPAPWRLGLPGRLSSRQGRQVAARRDQRRTGRVGRTWTRARRWRTSARRSARRSASGSRRTSSSRSLRVSRARMASSSTSSARRAPRTSTPPAMPFATRTRSSGAACAARTGCTRRTRPRRSRATRSVPASHTGRRRSCGRISTTSRSRPPAASIPTCT